MNLWKLCSQDKDDVLSQVVCKCHLIIILGITFFSYIKVGSSKVRKVPTHCWDKEVNKLFGIKNTFRKKQSINYLFYLFIYIAFFNV